MCLVSAIGRTLPLDGVAYTRQRLVERQLRSCGLSWTISLRPAKAALAYGEAHSGGRCFYLDHAVPGRSLEVEDPEVAAQHMDGDVVDRNRADAALEGSGVRVHVQDEIGPVLGDRSRQTVRAEEDLDPLRLTFERVRRGRVVEQHDAKSCPK